MAEAARTRSSSSAIPPITSFRQSPGTLRKGHDQRSRRFDLVRGRAVDGVVLHPREPLADRGRDFLARGANLWARTPCVKARGYERDDLIEGVVIAGASKMHEPIEDGAAALTF